ncbi:MAG: hypothetical protein GWP19_14825 [Planctomycetia bacterium]|nr:hypothetical protein [Planctomycetia bacterium]
MNRLSNKQILLHQFCITICFLLFIPSCIPIKSSKIIDKKESIRQVNRILIVIEESPLFYFKNISIPLNKDQLSISKNDTLKTPLKDLVNFLKQVFIENNIWVEIIIIPSNKNKDSINERNISIIPEIQISIKLSELFYTDISELTQPNQHFTFDILVTEFKSKEEILRTAIKTSDVNSGLYIAKKLLIELENIGLIPSNS